MLVAVACGTTVTPSGRREVPMTQVVTTQMSSYDGDTALIVGTTDAERARITQIVPGAAAASGGVLVAVFQGSQRTGGYAMRIDGIERDGDQLIIHATFTEPSPGAVVTQVLTSPAAVVTISSSDASGVRTAILLDAKGIERVRGKMG